MHNYVTVTILLLISFVYINAQESNFNETPKTRISEFGMTTSNFKDFGLNHKFGREDFVFRINFSQSTGSTSALIDVETDDIYDFIDKNRLFSSYGFSLAFGIEKRKILNENLEIKIGTELQGNLLYENLEFERRSGSSLNGYDYKQTTDTLTFGPNLIIGAQYVFNKKIVFGIELNPGVYFGIISYDQNRKNYNNLGGIESIEKENSKFYEYGLNLSRIPILINLNYRIYRNKKTKIKNT